MVAIILFADSVTLSSGIILSFTYCSKKDQKLFCLPKNAPFVNPPGIFISNPELKVSE
jgi:hypothetical protein